MPSQMRLWTAAVAFLISGLVICAADPFEAGTAWDGHRTFKEKAQPWSLKVTDRDGKTFKGEITLQTKGDPKTFKVIGRAGAKASGKVAFETDQKGDLKQRFEGEFADGKMELTFSGTSPAGKAFSGTATLSASAPGSAKTKADRSTKGLSKDEVELLQLAGATQFYVNGADQSRPKWSAAQRRAVIVRHDDGRGRAVASVALLRELLFISLENTFKENAEFYAALPDDLRKRGIQLGGYVLRGDDAPPLLRPTIPNLLVMNEQWFDGLRRNEVRKLKLSIELEKSRSAIARLFERDLAQALGSDKLAAKEFEVRAEGADTVGADIAAKAGRKTIPRTGQFLRLTYAGAKPLTNVVLVARVQSIGESKELEGGQNLVDAMNKLLATPEQAGDANAYLTASNLWMSMPKSALLYVPRIAPGDEVSIAIGYMAPKTAAGHTLAVYADQGRVGPAALDEFAPKPR